MLSVASLLWSIEVGFAYRWYAINTAMITSKKGEKISLLRVSSRNDAQEMKVGYVFMLHISETFQEQLSLLLYSCLRCL